MSDPYQTQGNHIIGEYRLERKLGGGGFGIVYLAEHIHEHSQVAIKILQVPLIKPEDFRGFIKEAGTMTLLRHPHIIPLLYFNVSSEGFPFLVMEYASQGTLRDRHPKETRVPLASIVEYVEQIASALQYAHDHRIIHRDVKPENMLLRADGTLLLSDFGIAKIMEHSTLMSVQTQIGTPIYMAPEQHIGHPCFASDQYALAVVVYEWISGKRPFQGTSFGLAVQHMTVSPTSLLNLMPTLPPSIEQVIFKALSKEPEHRFATVQEFATAFRAAVQEANLSEIDVKKVIYAQNPSKEAIIRQPITTAIHTEAEIDTTPAPQLPPQVDAPIESSPEINTPLLPQSPTTDPPIEPDPKIDTPPVPKRSPLDEQSIEPDAHIRPSATQTNYPPSSNQTYSTAPTPILSPSVARGKPSRRLVPAKRNLLLLGSISLVGLIILALFINLLAANAQNQQPGNHQSHTPSATHPTPTVLVLNAHTVSLLTKKWNFPTESYVESSPAAVNGVIYVGSDDNNVYAINALSGKQIWAFSTQGPVASSPVVVDGVVYVGSDDSSVYAINAQSGKQIWAFPTGNLVHSSPAVVDGVVYIGSQDGNVYAIDAQSGKQKWAFPTQGPVPPSSGPPQGPPPFSSIPAVVNGVVYVGSDNNNVYAINALSGKQIWAFPTGGSVVSSPVVVAGVVYAGSLDKRGPFDKHIYAIDTQTGQQKWVIRTGGSLSSSPPGPPQQGGAPPPSVTSAPVVKEGIVYIGADNSNVYALDALSGEKKWTFHAAGSVVSSPTVVNGVVYIGAFDGNLYAIDAQSGLKEWFFHTGDQVYSSPLVADKMVYVGSLDGNLYAFGLPTTTA